MADQPGRVRNMTGNGTQWGQGNPTIGRGEIAVQISNGITRFKIGDGVRRFLQLDWAIASSAHVDYIQLLGDLAPGQAPQNSFFIDQTDGVLKFKDSTNLVRIVNLI